MRTCGWLIWNEILPGVTAEGLDLFEKRGPFVPNILAIQLNASAFFRGILPGLQGQQSCGSPRGRAHKVACTGDFPSIRQLNGAVGIAIKFSTGIRKTQHQLNWLWTLIHIDQQPVRGMHPLTRPNSSWAQWDSDDRHPRHIKTGFPASRLDWLRRAVLARWSAQDQPQAYSQGCTGPRLVPQLCASPHLRMAGERSAQDQCHW